MTTYPVVIGSCFCQVHVIKCASDRERVIHQIHMRRNVGIPIHIPVPEEVPDLSATKVRMGMLVLHFFLIGLDCYSRTLLQKSVWHHIPSDR